MKIDIAEFALGVSFGCFLTLFLKHLSSTDFHQQHFPEYVMSYDFSGILATLVLILLTFLKINTQRIQGSAGKQ